MSRKNRTIETFDRDTAKLKAWLVTLEDRTPEQLNYSPSSDRWSTLQILEHLRQSEFRSLRYLNYKLENSASFPHADWRSPIRGFKVWLSMRWPFKIKAPKVKGLSPSNDGLEFWDIRGKWLDNRTNMRVFFERLSDDAFAWQMYKHPYGGRITLPQMILFFREHIRRHRKQIVALSRQWS